MSKNNKNTSKHNNEMQYEKAKDFKKSIKRTLKELKPFKILVIISLILSALSSILSLFAPDKLKELTDTITEGLVVNQENIKELNEQIAKNFQNGIPQEITIDNTTISIIDQQQYIEKTKNLTKDTNVNELYKKIQELPESIKTVISPKMNIEKIKTITIFLVILYVISAIFNLFEGLVMSIVSNKFAKDLRAKITKKINKLPLKYFDKHQTGDILSRVTNDVDTIGQTMNQSLGTLVSAITLFIGTIIMMFITNWIMSITAIVSSILGFALMMIVMTKSQKYFNEKQKKLGQLNAHIEEIYTGINVVRISNAREYTKKEFDKLNKQLKTSNQKSQFLSGLMPPMMSFIGNFGYVAVCIVGALLTINNKITFGVIVAFMTYVRMFTSPLTQIAQAMTSLQSTAAAGERVFEFIDEQEMQKENPKHKLDKKEVKGNIEFQDVVFTYDGNDKPTINNFSAKIKPGQKVAIVGPTGAGKTTIVNLLMRFYEINSGTIKIDNIDTKELSRQNVHELFTMVLQDTWLFEGTIKENIIYNRKNIKDKQIKEVCEEVGIDHFIKTLPEGYNSKVTDNDDISSGQKQLITIARAMIENSPFLILDEATSNVDTRTEELVQTAMDKLTKGKTSFIIAHRLSTIKNADLILVMKDGNIIETGNHEQLINKKGFYEKLYNSQFEL